MYFMSNTLIKKYTSTESQYPLKLVDTINKPKLSAN